MDGALPKGYATGVHNYLGYLRHVGDVWYYWVGLSVLSLLVLGITFLITKDREDGYARGGVFASIVFVLGAIVTTDSETSRELVAMTKQGDLVKLQSEQIELVEGYLTKGLENRAFTTVGKLPEDIVIPEGATNNLVELTFKFGGELLENKLVYIVSTDTYKDRELIEFDLSELKVDLKNAYNTLVSAKEDYSDDLWDVNGFNIVRGSDTTAEEVMYILNVKK